MLNVIRIALLAVTLPAAGLFAAHHLAGAETRLEVSASSRGNPLDPSAVVILTARVLDAAGSPVGRGSVTFRVNGTDLGVTSVDRSGVASLRVMPRDATAIATYVIEATYRDDMYEPSRAVVTYSGRPGALSATEGSR